MNKVVHFFIVCLLLQTNLFAQIPGLTQFTTNNGLASNTIYDTAQDENGFMWFATDYGISKFDGLTFKNFTITDGLPGNEILILYKDSQNRIWMVAFNGNIGFIKNGILYNENNAPFLKNLKFTTYVSDIFEDSKGQLWFYQNFNNIRVLQTDLNIISYKLKNDKYFKYKSLFIEDKSKKVHLLTYKEINKNISIVTKPISSDQQKSEWKDFNPTKFTQSSKENINNHLGVLLRDQNEIIKNISDFLIHERNNFLTKTYKIGNNYWITNLNAGVLIFTDSDNYSIPKTILKNVQTTRAYVDLEQNIWIGSQSNGIYLFPNLHINGIKFEDENKNDLHSVNFFKDEIVVGNEQSEIIFLKPETLKTTATFLVDEHPKRIRQLNVKDNHLYILSDFNVHQLNSDLKLSRIKNMYDVDFRKSKLGNFKDLAISKNYIYTAIANGIVRIDKNNNTFNKIWNKRSTSVFLTEKNDLWIGTTSGLYRNYNNTTKKYDLGKHFNNSIIYALENSSKGLLIGSNSYGLGILKGDDFKIISKENGLLSNYIKSIFIDQKNNIWLSTNFGLNYLELNENNEIKVIKSYTTSDGLYSNDVRASYVKGNKVYVATSKGLNIINLSKEVNSILAPRVYINEIHINNSLIEKSIDQTFNNQLNNVQFNFSGISFRSLGNITFKYRLKGLEPDWITTKTNSIRYSSLPPNNYTFELKAISKNNFESVPVLFPFIISPPMYKTWWFISLCVSTLISIIIIIFYRRNLKIKNIQQTKEQISNLRYKSLNAQMNPHFINNLLVNINNLADQGEIEEVKGSLDKFAELVNLVLNATKSNLINLNDEIEMTKLYLELQKLRFNKNISFSINTQLIPQEELEAILVPPMILQPIIENSFKHGFKNATKKNNISVNFKIENDEFLYCEILDNGKGIQNIDSPEKSKESGISFSNINERLQLIHDSNNKEKLVLVSNITDEFNNLVGLKVTLKIPLICF